MITKPSTWNGAATTRTNPTTKNQSKSVSGFVVHQDENSGDIWSTSFSKSDQYCRLIDGLFMSFDVESCLKYDFSFDERFDFHHYDITASIRAQKAGLKIITSPIQVVHKGMGQLDESWQNSHKVFIAAYGDFLG